MLRLTARPGARPAAPVSRRRTIPTPFARLPSLFVERGDENDGEEEDFDGFRPPREPDFDDSDMPGHTASTRLEDVDISALVVEEGAAAAVAASAAAAAFDALCAELAAQGGGPGE